MLLTICDTLRETRPKKMRRTHVVTVPRVSLTDMVLIYDGWLILAELVDVSLEEPLHLRLRQQVSTQFQCSGARPDPTD